MYQVYKKLKMGIHQDQEWKKDDSWRGKSYYIPKFWTEEDC